MTTVEYINWIQKRTGNQVTVDEMRVLVNEAQNKIFTYNTYFNKKKPQSSCFIDTTSGILQYTISDGSMRTLTEIYTIDGYDERVIVPTEIESALSPGDDIIVYFKEDPGTTTEQYYYDAYLWPFNGQITSTSVQLSLPSKAQTDLLFFMVSKMLEVDKDGRSIYNDEEEQRWLRDWFTFANKGTGSEPSTPKYRGV